MHRVLKQALAQAVAWHELSRNEADAVKPPKVERKRMKVFDAEEAADLIETARATSLFIPIFSASPLGCAAARSPRYAGATSISIMPRSRSRRALSRPRGGVRYKPPKSGKGRTVALSGDRRRRAARHRIEQAQGFSRLAFAYLMTTS